MIIFDKVYKEYELGSFDHNTFQKDLFNFFKISKNKINNENNKIIALKNINFEIQNGDIVGLIGNNGSGKSTLLKILSKITTPTNGQIFYDGTVASLLEVGVGFHPELSGYDNICLNAAIFGLKKKDIYKKIDDIIEFSGLRKFIDTPIKRYSSGMLVKLGFSVAAFLEPDIFIIDEVLAVGDNDFRNKAIEKIRDFSLLENKIIIFVSHNMELIQKICNRCIVLENGQIKHDGKPDEIVKLYIKN